MAKDESKDQGGAEAAAKAPKANRLVKVKVAKAIAFGGCVVRPIVDSKGKVTPVLAYIPADVADAHGIEPIADAPAGAKVGLVPQQ